jgi:hypothetical protein
MSMRTDILVTSSNTCINRDFDAQEIAPDLYLGDVYAAHNTQEQKNRSITHIVTCTVGVLPPFPEVCNVAS